MNSLYLSEAMRILILILFSAIPLSSEAVGGWHFRSVSAFYGLSYNRGNSYGNSFEFLYEKGRSSCLIRPRYFGLGVGGNFSKDSREIGLKGQIIPGHLHWSTYGKRGILLLPYAYLQGNMQKQFIPGLEAYTNGFNCRPGLGITTQPRTRYLASLRANLQAGYTISSLSKTTTPFLIEFKLGIGINPSGHSNPLKHHLPE
jgi:hypothetical protein